MKKAFKIFTVVIFQLFTTMIAGLSLVMIYAMSGLIFSFYTPIQGDVNHLIYLRSNGIHTDLCLPVKSQLYDWNSFLNPEDFSSHKDAIYYSFGWGDRDFYTKIKTWDDFSATVATKAMLIPTRTAMHVEALKGEPQVSDYCLSFEITDRGYMALCEYIKGSFVVRHGRPQLIPEISYYGSDRFYEANESYHLFETCNSWTNAGLKNAGVKTAAWNLFAHSLLNFHQ